MVKKLSLLLVLVLTVNFLFSCSVTPSYAELILPLGKEFYETEQENFDASYTDGESVVAVIRISFEAGIASGIIDTLTPTEFGRYWLKRCGRNAEIKYEGSVTYATYYDGAGYFYLEAFYRSHHAYFTVLFAGNENNEEELFSKFLNYADGVRIKNE